MHLIFIRPLVFPQVGLSEAQLQVVMSKRKYVRSERHALAQCEQMLKEVREVITGHLRSLNHHIDEIQNVMTPLQLAKFYMWVENNEWCMQMLNTMFTTPSQQAVRKIDTHTGRDEDERTCIIWLCGVWCNDVCMVVLIALYVLMLFLQAAAAAMQQAAQNQNNPSGTSSSNPAMTIQPTQ